MERKEVESKMGEKGRRGNTREEKISKESKLF
jgi:hypothetical protein